MYQALYRTWRPRTFDDVVGQRHITDTLRRQVAAGKESHAYLFTGTRGTGKTSCAKIIARAVNCEQPVDGNPCNQCPSCRGVENGSIMDVLELDAASNNGVDQIRALRDEAIFTPASVKKRVYIVDEVHMLTTAAFNALLKILEEPPEHLMFVLATTELHKVPATIRSRCQQFAFKRIAPQDIAIQLMKISKAEQIPLTEEGAALLARLANGGMRDALSLLDQCAGEEQNLDETAILERLSLAGNADTAELLNHIAAGDTGSALAVFARLYDAGREPGSVLGELSTLVRDLLIRSAAPAGGDGLLTGGYDGETLKSLLAKLDVSRLLGMLTLLQRMQAELMRSPSPRIEAELCILKLCGTPEQVPAVVAAQVAPANQPRRQAQQAAMPEDKPPFEVPPPPMRQTPAATMQAEPQLSPTPKPVDSPPQAVSTPNLAPSVPSMADENIIQDSRMEESWGGLLSRLLPGLPGSLKGLFADGNKVYGELKGEVLVLYADGDMTYQTISRKRSVEAVESMMEQLLKRKIACQVKVGLPEGMQPIAPPVSSGTFDPLESLDISDAIRFED